MAIAMNEILLLLFSFYFSPQSLVCCLSTKLTLKAQLLLPMNKRHGVNRAENDAAKLICISPFQQVRFELQYLALNSATAILKSSLVAKCSMPSISSIFTVSFQFLSLLAPMRDLPRIP